MLQLINKKKYILYIFFFLILTTINNLKVKKLNIFAIKNIEIINQSEKFYDESFNNKLIQEFDYLLNRNIFFIDKEKLNFKLLNNKLISNFKIKKNYPSKLVINYEKTRPIANIILDNQNFLIGSNYKLIETENMLEDLPNVFGKPKMKQFRQIIEQVNLSNINFDDITDYYYFKSMRWNIRLNNGILIKLPEDNFFEYLNLAWKILENEKVLIKNTLNLSVKNQVIID
tara:strand:+ start:713 stop:1399 length:687 start_codon:yes stop_codon:yes gene_type:complete